MFTGIECTGLLASEFDCLLSRYTLSHNQFLLPRCYKFYMEEYKYTKVQNKYERVSRFGNHLLQISEVKKIVFGNSLLFAMYLRF